MAVAVVVVVLGEHADSSGSVYIRGTKKPVDLSASTGVLVYDTV